MRVVPFPSVQSCGLLNAIKASGWILLTCLTLLKPTMATSDEGKNNLILTIQTSFSSVCFVYNPGYGFESSVDNTHLLKDKLKPEVQIEARSPLVQK